MESSIFGQKILKFLKNDIEIIISPLKSVNICNDKLSFSEYFSNKSVGVINLKQISILLKMRKSMLLKKGLAPLQNQ